MIKVTDKQSKKCRIFTKIYLLILYIYIAFDSVLWYYFGIKVGSCGQLWVKVLKIA